MEDRYHSESIQIGSARSASFVGLPRAEPVVVRTRPKKMVFAMAVRVSNRIIAWTVASLSLGAPDERGPPRVSAELCRIVLEMEQQTLLIPEPRRW